MLAIVGLLIRSRSGSSGSCRVQNCNLKERQLVCEGLILFRESKGRYNDHSHG